MMHIDESSLWRIVHRMEEAAILNGRHAEQMEQAAQRIAYLLEPGYGGNGLKLIELLEQAELTSKAMTHQGS